jgi:hypothetical protein
MISRAMLSLPLFLSLAVARGLAQTDDCREVMVPMRDGVELATDVYLPKAHGAGPFPVVLTRTPYGKGDCEDTSAQYSPSTAVAPGTSAAASIEGRLLLASGQRLARARRLRHHRVGGESAMVERQGGDDGPSFTCANQLSRLRSRPTWWRCSAANSRRTATSLPAAPLT